MSFNFLPLAISNSRLVACDDTTVTFRWKDYRARRKGAPWLKTMTLAVDDFIRRFLIHVLPRGFHRIRHYGLFASATRATTIARIRDLLGAVPPTDGVFKRPKRHHRHHRAPAAAGA